MSEQREPFVNFNCMWGEISYKDMTGTTFVLSDNSGKYVPEHRRAETYDVCIRAQSGELAEDCEGDKYYPVKYLHVGVIDKKHEEESLRDLHNRICDKFERKYGE